MKLLTSALYLTALLPIFAYAQSKPNASIETAIRKTGKQNTFRLSYDPDSNVSKLMMISGNFPSSDMGRIGVEAMHFVVGFMYSGQEISSRPDSMILTFWVLSRKPRFAKDHGLVLSSGVDRTDLGQARYISKTRENMEYLNFNIDWSDLEKIASGTVGEIKLGDHRLNLTAQQKNDLLGLLRLSDPER